MTPRTVARKRLRPETKCWTSFRPFRYNGVCGGCGKFVVEWRREPLRKAKETP